MFSSLSGPRLASLTADKCTILYKKRQMIFYEGNRPVGLYCILSGLVKVFKTGEDGGRHQIVRLATPGGLLGYRALLAEESYAASAEAIVDSEVCVIYKEKVMKALSEDSATSLWIIKKLCRDLREAEKKERDLALKGARERLVELLLALDAALGESRPEGRQLKMHLTREEMAEMIGVAPETVIRLLHELQKDQLLSLKTHVIVLTDITALQALTNTLVTDAPG